MTVPDAAVEAAAKAIHDREGGTTMDSERLARAAIEAAMPAIREAIAQEIEAEADDVGRSDILTSKAFLAAARIVLGGTP